MAPLPSPRVLCVNGSPAVLGEWKSSFQNYGCEVVTATHGREALTQFYDCHGIFAAMILEHELTGMTGVALVRHVRALSYQGYVLITARSLTCGDLHAYADMAVSGFFRNPVKADMAAAILTATMAGTGL